MYTGWPPFSNLNKAGISPFFWGFLCLNARNKKNMDVNDTRNDALESNTNYICRQIDSRYHPQMLKLLLE